MKGHHHSILDHVGPLNHVNYLNLDWCLLEQPRVSKQILPIPMDIPLKGSKLCELLISPKPCSSIF